MCLIPDTVRQVRHSQTHQTLPDSQTNCQVADDTFCNIQTLLTNGIALIGEQANEPEENLMAVQVVINVPLST